MASTSEQLNAMRLLKEGWDGYGAAAPESDVLELASEFVALIDAIRKKCPTTSDLIHVSPTRIGGVLVEWEDAALQHEVEINPDRSFSFLHIDKATGMMETRKLLPDDHAVVQLQFLQELSQLLAA